jgi:hypothetical protein
MRRLAERIIASDGDIETLNEQCRWCVRRHQCKELGKHVEVGGPLSLTDPFEAADKRVKLLAAKNAITQMIDDVDTLIIDYMEHEELPEFSTDATKVSITMKSQRDIDERRAALIIGPQLMAERSGVTLTMVDKFLKGTDITPEQRMNERVGPSDPGDRSASPWRLTLGACATSAQQQHDENNDQDEHDCTDADIHGRQFTRLSTRGERRST